jgi:hypothetical protein
MIPTLAAVLIAIGTCCLGFIFGALYVASDSQRSDQSGPE